MRRNLRSNSAPALFDDAPLLEDCDTSDFTESDDDEFIVDPGDETYKQFILNNVFLLINAPQPLRLYIFDLTDHLMFLFC